MRGPTMTTADRGGRPSPRPAVALTALQFLLDRIGERRTILR
jgi:hypothetical protein